LRTLTSFVSVVEGAFGVAVVTMQRCAGAFARRAGVRQRILGTFGSASLTIFSSSLILCFFFSERTARVAFVFVISKIFNRRVAFVFVISKIFDRRVTFVSRRQTLVMMWSGIDRQEILVDDLFRFSDCLLLLR